MKNRIDFSGSEFRNKNTYRTLDLGAICKEECTVLKLWAPTSDSVDLILYRTGSDEEDGAEKINTAAMNREDAGVWKIELSGNYDGIYYTYRIVSEGVARETADPYATACGVNGNRSMLVNLSATDPDGWEEDALFTPKNTIPIIYELHVKDFSNDENCGVFTEHRGKYLAFTEDNTTLKGEGNHPTCLSYLKKLGITYVHLLPVFDFASVDETALEASFNWGYDPKNYNAPEGSYSTNPWNGSVRIRELKEMVQSLHKAGIGVILDVVYNHTYDLNSSFQKTVQDYYYRQKKDGTFANGSACGNEMASERTMFGNFIKQSVLYWAKEYHVDGFRFDLMGLHPVEGMNEIRSELNTAFPNKRILLYGEPWAAEVPSMEKGYIPALKKNIALLSEDIAIFCDSTRDAIKGDVFKVMEPGFINGGVGFEKKIQSAVTAFSVSSEAWTPKSPAQIITYVSAHDNYTLWDKLLLSTGKTDFSRKYPDILAMNRLAAAIVFTSFGIPFFQAGEEFARTKQGVEDSYCSPAALNQLDWSRTVEYEDLVEYYRGLIQFRKEADAFYNGDKTSVDLITFEKIRHPGVVSFLHKRRENTKAPWEILFVAYNSSEKKVSLSLPLGNWRLLIDAADSKCFQKEKIVIHEIQIPEKSAIVLGR